LYQTEWLLEFDFRYHIHFFSRANESTTLTKRPANTSLGTVFVEHAPGINANRDVANNSLTSFPRAALEESKLDYLYLRGNPLVCAPTTERSVQLSVEGKGLKRQARNEMLRQLLLVGSRASWGITAQQRGRLSKTAKSHAFLHR